MQNNYLHISQVLDEIEQELAIIEKEILNILITTEAVSN